MLYAITITFQHFTASTSEPASTQIIAMLKQLRPA